MSCAKILLCLLLGLATACQAKPPDFAEQPLTDLVELEGLPHVTYRHLTWLDENTLALVYQEIPPVPIDYFKPATLESFPPYRIGLYQIAQRHWRELILPTVPAFCVATTVFIQDIERAPDGTLVYSFACHSNEMGRGITGFLVQWDPQSESFTTIGEYSRFPIGPVTFAPDMQTWIQESRIGDGLNNELYWVEAGGQIRQLFPRFQRASSPSWSPGGTQIAFIGTDTEPFEMDEPKRWSQIENLLLYPWDLYLINSDGTDVQILFPQIGRPYQMVWTPDEEKLLFAGRRPGVEGGIWLLDLAAKEIDRLWPYNTYFALSPDGKKLVLIREEESEDGTHTYPVVAELPQP